MTLIPEVHDALATAIVARNAKRRRMIRARRGGLCAIAAVAATGSSLAATGHWDPVPHGHEAVAATLVAGSAVISATPTRFVLAGGKDRGSCGVNTSERFPISEVTSSCPVSVSPLRRQAVSYSSPSPRRLSAPRR